MLVASLQGAGKDGQLEESVFILAVQTPTYPKFYSLGLKE